MTDMFDAIVVGMGPGGSMAACRLARGGLKVLALEKSIMPRPKLCAGAITPKAFNLIDIDITEAIEQEIHGGVVHAKSGFSMEMASQTEHGLIVDRPRFDHLLLKRAAAAGAIVHEGERLIHMHPGAMTTVVTNAAAYQARYVIGADGANSMVARALGYPRRHSGYTLECFIPDTYAPIQNAAGCLVLYYGYLPSGYAWIFPRTGGALVGIGVLKRHSRRIRTHFHDFLTAVGLPGEYAEHCKGFPLPAYTFGTTRRQGRANILLVGDAACLIDPITGEGIAFAMQSGELAAQAVIDAVRLGREADALYAARLKPLREDLLNAYMIAVPLNQFPNLSLLSLKENPPIAEALKDILLGRGRYRTLLKLGIKAVPSTFQALFTKGILG